MIDDQLLEAYIAELGALRAHGREFASAYPDIAARLDIGPRRSRDPQVERLVEASAFLAARLRLMIEQHAAELPMTLLTLIAPTLTEPVPAMALVRFRKGSENQTLARGTRFDYWTEHQPLVGLTTTMETEIAPVHLKVRRMMAGGGFADGIALRINGKPGRRLTLCVGNDELTAATILDALSNALVRVEIASPDGRENVTVPMTAIRWHGFRDHEASLPIRPGTHRAHRLLTEAMAFEAKFRFISVEDPRLVNGAELRFRFHEHLALPDVVRDDLITTNCAPAINLWRGPASPIDVTGRRIEYPVRVDTHRYRLIECHSVEEVELHGPGQKSSSKLDPMVSAGNLLGTDIRWGTRRTASRNASEVYLYFRGLDYRVLGEKRFLATPQVLASNGDLPQRTRVGSVLQPVESLGDWECRLATVPSRHIRAITDSDALRTLLSYVQSGLRGIVGRGRSALLKEYLRAFPGGKQATWIEGIGDVTARPAVSFRGGFAQPTTTVTMSYDPGRSRTTSQALVSRLLTELGESQRGLNQIENFIVGV